MNQFVDSPVHFAADCVRQNGRCLVVRDNFLFLEDGKELAAVDYLQKKCGHVVILPDASNEGNALLYHTSCARMTDVVNKIFPDCLEAPMSLPQAASEMTVGELHRHRVTIPFNDCRTRVEGFGFQSIPARNFRVVDGSSQSGLARMGRRQLRQARTGFK
jgi:hypothetical protein